MRLDIAVAQKYSLSRNKAKQLIELSQVLLDGKICNKSSVQIDDNSEISICNMFSYASIGGEKLAKALTDFNYCVDGKRCADIGASNGGFTDCLLQNGAVKVVAVDIGECAFKDNLLNDERVEIKDKTNARYINAEDIGCECDFVCVDVSFISLKLILPAVYRILKIGGDVIALIKPQFEVGQAHLSKSGIVTDPKIREKAVSEIISFANNCGLKLLNKTHAPLRDKKNVEYLVLLHKL
ncbi:MAG: TlyA family RNA methyltransferase [Clostridia bacterium]|nr:TlyA family RNA methyltransferase [Clostridia bacterium]